MKKIFFSIIGFILSINYTLASSLKADMTKDLSLAGATGDGTGALTNVVVFFKNFIFSILGLIVVGVFLYLGYNLISSRGKPDEFKNALMGLIYAMVGMTIIPLAYAAVKIISSLNF